MSDTRQGSNTNNVEHMENSEYRLGQDLRNGRTDTFVHQGHEVRCKRTAQGHLALTLPDGRTATTPGLEGMIEYRGSVSYLLSNTQVQSVTFDREGMAHVSAGTENYALPAKATQG